jgi:hypothetical protein
MKKMFRCRKKWLGGLAMLAALAAGASAKASTFTFASFSDSTDGQWSYHAGALTATAANATFTSFGGPNQVLAFTGPVTYAVSATGVGAPTDTSGIITQTINGDITFMHGSTLVLNVVFTGAIIIGEDGSGSTGVQDDMEISGTSISYSTSSMLAVAPFVTPNLFSISLTQSPGISISGSELSDFTATATGSFATTPFGSGASPATPLPRASFSAPLLLLGILGFRRLRRKLA